MPAVSSTHREHSSSASKQHSTRKSPEAFRGASRRVAPPAERVAAPAKAQDLTERRRHRCQLMHAPTTHLPPKSAPLVLLPQAPPPHPHPPLGQDHTAPAWQGSPTGMPCGCQSLPAQTGARGVLQVGRRAGDSSGSWEGGREGRLKRHASSTLTCNSAFLQTIRPPAPCCSPLLSHLLAVLCCCWGRGKRKTHTHMSG